MKLASSIRYGGQLVAAEECSYDDFLLLGLHCPECQEPVILRNTYQRQLQNGKIVNISAAFVHRKAIDPATAQLCHLRVSRYDKTEIEHRASIARGQREKLLNMWFWEVFGAYSPSFNMYKNLLQKEGFPKHWSPRLKLFKRYVKENKQQILKTAKLLVERSPSVLDRATLLNPSPDAKEQKNHFLKVARRVSKLNIELHLAICSEVLDFLSQPRSNDLLLKVAMLCVLATHASEDSTSLAIEEVLPISWFVSWLVFTPWADEFAKLSEKSRPEEHTTQQLKQAEKALRRMVRQCRARKQPYDEAQLRKQLLSTASVARN
ncbi:MAG: hypothetical protein CLLPBCKN_005575 [Chroococcidiopsis cubana SAG 39.79]|uniref:DUF4158 domain-containing protein n=1 Tax=Chroococcidiopsis cubana SAG 39.79 TaxID=388085 RepID=A0AB37UPS1_9CYAN|nr:MULTISPECIES: hypothetical protein [Chroococcidiopsis]MDZ4876155.1 hypothetical protein [Chroococcidiopsis cubana SAG 39.79]PSB64708.1 hypothetical protein C7B79_08605 [Chroococcidiopsis cubana CCALA 043]RUT13378.1 hypothetical protein DSM107010_13330 [Chroococcidiopsis cubana SAG 39.79]URD49418.1 hypothetical protein M5J74_24240 [Chroococcidiopsis sp. CCNUC1]